MGARALLPLQCSATQMVISGGGQGGETKRGICTYRRAVRAVWLYTYICTCRSAPLMYMALVPAVSARVIPKPRTASWKRGFSLTPPGIFCYCWRRRFDAVNCQRKFKKRFCQGIVDVSYIEDLVEDQRDFGSREKLPSDTLPRSVCICILTWAGTLEFRYSWDWVLTSSNYVHYVGKSGTLSSNRGTGP